MVNRDFDVIVVGGGPGGSAAAKKCAEEGLKTLLLEKCKLPRNKVCTGMIMSEMSQTLVKGEFGDLPKYVLATPSCVEGIEFRGPSDKNLTFRREMPFVWRKDFDYWLNQVAQKAGAELWDTAKVKSIEVNGNGYLIWVEKQHETQPIRTRFLIGADGAVSVVRKTLFPEIKMKYQLCVQQCYQGSVDLDPCYVHYFFFSDLSGFEVNRKGEFYLLEITPRSGQGVVANTIKQAEEWLSQDFGFTTGTKPLWRKGCVEPSMTRKPFLGDFPLAKGNALIVGNAAGLTKPITGEGIGTAIKSGLMAAEAVIQASKREEKADKFYLPMARDLVLKLGSLYPVSGSLRKKSNDAFLSAFSDIYSRITNIL